MDKKVNLNDDFWNYTVVKEPTEEYKHYNWETAIGLQDVDRNKTIKIFKKDS